VGTSVRIFDGNHKINAEHKWALEKVMRELGELEVKEGRCR
jgi:hypothetical protein